MCVATLPFSAGYTQDSEEQEAQMISAQKVGDLSNCSHKRRSTAAGMGCRPGRLYVTRVFSRRVVSKGESPGASRVRAGTISTTERIRQLLLLLLLLSWKMPSSSDAAAPASRSFTDRHIAGGSMLLPSDLANVDVFRVSADGE